MSFWDKLSSGFSQLANIELSSRLNSAQQTQSLSTPPTFGSNFTDSSANAVQQNSAILHSVASTATNVPGQSAASPINTPKPIFKTEGGDWRRDNNDNIKFYRSGENTTGTTRVDEEYYKPSEDKYPLSEQGKWVRLNARGDQRSLLQNQNQPRPENISKFDWQGYEWVDAAQVPASYTSEGKTVAFADQKAAQNQLNALKRYVVDNNLVGGAWDEAKFQSIFGAKAGSEIKLELEAAGEANGKTVYNVRMSEESLAQLRQGLEQYRRETGSDALGGAQGQQEQTNIFFDIPKVYARAAVKIVQDTVNTAAEIVDPSVKTDPHNWTRAKIGDIMDAQLPTPQNGARQTSLPRVDASPIMPDYNSDLFNRDVLTGEVNKDGVTVGKLTETAVELAAPTIVAKAAPPAKLAEDARALFYEPQITAVAGYPKGVAITTKYGDIWYSPHGSKIDKALAINHEKVHSALTPKLLIGRDARFKVMKLSDKSHFMKYLEEFLSESYAQIKVKGFKEGDLRFAAKFMLNNENYNIKLSRVITEGAIATATIAGVEYGVYVATDAILNDNKK